jgi:hypothetical protein
MLDLPCRFAVVDVLDVLGTNRMNVSKNIEKVRSVSFPPRVGPHCPASPPTQVYCIYIYVYIYINIYIFIYIYMLH